MKENEILHEMNQLKAEMAELKKSNESKGIKGYLGRAMNRTSVVTGVLIALVMATVVLYASQISFENGKIIDADHVNNNFDELYAKVTALETQSSTVMAPVGAIVAWHEDMTSNTSLTIPAGWMKCDGQAVADSESPFNGQNLPDLNGEARFLRGGANSGVLQDDAMQRMTGYIGGASLWATGHEQFQDGVLRLKTDCPSTYNSSGTNAGTEQGFIFDSSANGLYKTDGDGSGDGETRPVNMSVIWIIRVK